jgi:hypothetical protein
MKVRIVSVNVPARQLSVVPVEPLVGARKKATLELKKPRGRRAKRKR